MELTQELVDLAIKLEKSSDDLIAKVRFDDLGRIIDLALDLKGVRSLRSGIFEPFPDLKFLTLSYYEGSHLPESLFDSLEQLQLLRVVKSEIRELPFQIFRKLIHLYHLELADTQLKMLHKKIFSELHGLKILSLHNNNLQSLPETIFHPLKSLERINLKGNKLKSLPSDLFRGLDNLNVVDLRDNILQQVPQNLFLFVANLYKLDLRGNHDLPGYLQKEFTELFMDEWREASLTYRFSTASDYDEIAEIINKTKDMLFFRFKDPQFRIELISRIINTHCLQLVERDRKKALSLLRITN